MKKLHAKIVIAAFLALLLMFAISGSFDIIKIIHQGISWLGLNNDLNADNSPDPQIFFLETSGRSYLSLREVCCIESAARAHPRSNISLLTSTSEPIAALSQQGTQWVRVGRDLIPNLNPVLLRPSDILEGTPLHEWYSSGTHQLSDFPVEHLSDALRLALLWKHGGIYLDIDVMVLRPLSELRNVVGLESPDGVNGAVLSFDKGSNFLEACMREYVAGYKPEVWGFQGPLLLTRMLWKLCGTENLVGVQGQPHRCHGVAVLPVRSFYPVPYQNWEDLFIEVEGVAALESMKDRSFTVHLWGKFTRLKMTEVGSGSTIDALAEEYCPKTYAYIQKQIMF